MSRITDKKTVYGTLIGGSEKMRLNPSLNPRITIDFNEAIDAARLRAALTEAVKSCPFVMYRMERCKGGLCYKENEAPLKLFTLSEEPAVFDCDEDNHHLVHVLYEDKQLVVSFSHGLTDGGGIQWFIDALLKAYFAVGEAAYKGYGAEDYDVDLMEKPLSVRSDYVYKDPVPRPIFRLPEAGLRKFFVINIISSMLLGNKKTFRYNLVLNRIALKEYCKQNNCSVSVAIAVMLSEAVMRVHPENKKAMTVRMPVNTRNILNAKNTFQNASMPQAALEILPDELKNARPEAIEKAGASLKEQLTYDNMAFLTNFFRQTAGGDKSKDTGVNSKAKVLSTLDTTLFISNMGECASAEIGDKINNMEIVADGGMPIMLYLLSAGDRIFVSAAQNFENRCYIDAFEQILAENNVLSH